MSAVFDARLLLVFLFLLTSFVLQQTLAGTNLVGYVAIIPALLGMQIFLNDFLEIYVIQKTRKTAFMNLLIAPGTILHELSHAFAAYATKCKIHEISLFSPHPKTKVLGYVAYSSPKDEWSSIRAVLIAFAPFFGCGIALLAVSNYLRLGLPDMWDFHFNGIASLVSITGSIIVGFYKNVLTLDLMNPLILLLVYLQLCFGLGAAPSTTDFRGAFRSVTSSAFNVLVLFSICSVMFVLGEYGPDYGRIGVQLSEAVVSLLTFIVFMLLVSTAYIIAAIPAAFVLGLILELKGATKLLPFIISFAAYWLLENVFPDFSDNVPFIAFVVFIAALFVLKAKGLFLKERNPQRKNLSR